MMTASDDRGDEPYLEWTKDLRERSDQITFGEKVSWSYNPLRYAWPVHRAYLRSFGRGKKRSVFLGMNPGPWGMGQTGIPFGDPVIAGDWMGLRGLEIQRPANQREQRPVKGWDSEREEGSGQRLFGYLRSRFGSLEKFFRDHFVLNYFPLVLFGPEARNVTPSKLLKADRTKVFEACDPYLREMVSYYEPEVLVGVGKFALRRLRAVFGEDGDHPYRIVDIPHPSPASPIATRDGGDYWRGLVEETLTEVDVLPAE